MIRWLLHEEDYGGISVTRRHWGKLPKASINIAVVSDKINSLTAEQKPAMLPPELTCTVTAVGPCFEQAAEWWVGLFID
jgi:hypothetical protein